VTGPAATDLPAAAGQQHRGSTRVVKVDSLGCTGSWLMLSAAAAAAAMQVASGVRWWGQKT
jgi:hypothetical protein